MSLPTVSIICPTYNRREFFTQFLKYIRAQTYSARLIQTVVVDDGTDPVSDLCAGDPQITYVRLEEKSPVGQKRNIGMKAATGDVIVWCDDDDYIHPKRVAHAVTRLQGSKKDLAGSTVMYIYFVDTQQVMRVGPYHNRHSTCGVMAFTRKYLNNHAFDDTAPKAEEASFTLKFTEPMVQLDPMQTILCIAHSSNTVDKSTIKDSPVTQFTNLKLKDFVKSAQDRAFYLKLGQQMPVRAPLVKEEKGPTGSTEPRTDHTRSAEGSDTQPKKARNPATQVPKNTRQQSVDDDWLVGTSLQQQPRRQKKAKRNANNVN